jgi:hypothetical protein
MVKIPNMFEENVQYELIPGDNDHWHIRIKEGEFIESVISFGKISMEEDSPILSFDLTLESSPDEELTSDNMDLQKYAGKILESIIVNNLNEVENKKQ